MNRMQVLLKAACASVVILSVLGCSSTEVKTEKDPQANLAQYRTYAWAPENPASDGPDASILDETVKADTDKILAAKGLQKTAPSEADLLVSYTAKTSTRVTYGWGWGPPQVVDQTPERTITLLFADSKLRRTVWQGSTSNTINDNGVSQKQIGEAIDDILKKYSAA